MDGSIRLVFQDVFFPVATAVHCSVYDAMVTVCWKETDETRPFNEANC